MGIIVYDIEKPDLYHFFLKGADSIIKERVEDRND